VHLNWDVRVAQFRVGGEQNYRDHHPEDHLSFECRTKSETLSEKSSNIVYVVTYKCFAFVAFGIEKSHRQESADVKERGHDDNVPELRHV